MIAVGNGLERASDELVGRVEHGVADRHRDAAIGAASAKGLVLSGEERDGFDHVTGNTGLASVVGYAGSGKSAMLGVAREAWEGHGYTVRGAALSGIAAENLEDLASSRGLSRASNTHGSRGASNWARVTCWWVEEAGMIGSRQMERVLSVARDSGAKVVLVGGPEQLQAIEAGAAFRSVAERHGAAEITEIRQQRDATRQLATGRTDEAVHAYHQRGMVHATDSREQDRGRAGR